MGSADMKRRGAVSEIDDEAATSKDIATDKNVVWRIKGGESYDLSLDVAGWQRDSNTEEGSDDWWQPGLVSFGVPNIFKFQMQGQRFTDGCNSRSGVDLRQGFDAWPPVDGADQNIDAGAVLDNVIDRLAKCDLGPSGFFVICHRDSRER